MNAFSSCVGDIELLSQQSARHCLLNLSPVVASWVSGFLELFLEKTTTTKILWLLFVLTKSGLYPKTHWEDMGTPLPFASFPGWVPAYWTATRPTGKWDIHSVSRVVARHRPKHPTPPWVLQRLGRGSVSQLPWTMGPRANPHIASTAASKWCFFQWLFRDQWEERSSFSCSSTPSSKFELRW